MGSGTEGTGEQSAREAQGRGSSGAGRNRGDSAWLSDAHGAPQGPQVPTWGVLSTSALCASPPSPLTAWPLFEDPYLPLCGRRGWSGDGTRDSGLGRPTHHNADSSPDAQRPECHPPGSTRPQGSGRAQHSQEGQGGERAGCWVQRAGAGAGGVPPPTPGHSPSAQPLPSHRGGPWVPDAPVCRAWDRL